MSEKKFAVQVLEMTSSNYNRIKRENGKGRIIKKEESQLTIEQIKKIKSDLQNRGYSGKLIDYAELQKLHQAYASQIEEKVFAQTILEISGSHYKHMKYAGNNAIILKSLITQVLPEDIERIRQELIVQGYEEKLIDYKELQKLHQMYGSQMTESRFAQDVLEMNYATYIGLKNTPTRSSKILKKAKKTSISSEEIEKIRKELQELGYAGKAISYSELRNLHKTYGSKISEAEFAQQVLELTYSQYHNVKDGQWNAIILKSLAVMITDEEVEKIKEELKVQGYENRFIDYSKIQELHQTYGKQMLEREFAQRVLGISDAHYGEVKAGRRKKARILRINTPEVKKAEKIQQFNLVFQEQKDSKEIEDIKKRLINDGYAGKTIDYQELQKLHKVYGNQIEEKNFAELILGLTYGQYMSVKNAGKVVILKSEAEVIEQEYIIQTKQELEKQGYVEKSINYEQLQILYQMYGKRMTESQFSQKVLEIGASQYKRMKKGTRNSIILKSLIKQETQEKIDKIKQELEMQGYSGKKINYTEFQELYSRYGNQMPEYKFAEKVLGISGALLGNMRRLPKARAKILTEVTIPISEEEINAIKEVLEEKGYGGKIIEYNELQLLHQTYGNQMREDIFAQVVLEIPRTAYYKKVKENGRGTKILCYNRKIELVRGMLFRDSRWYTKEEIEQICKENGISLDKVIRNIASNGTNLYNEDYKRVLNEKGRLWIGKVRMSNEFIERNLKLIMEKAKIALRSTKSRYGIRYNIEDEDMRQNAILWLMENAGSIEKNFSDYPEILERSIFNKLRRQIIIGVLSTFRIKAKTTSLNRKLTPKKKADKSKEGDELGSRIASNYNLEEDVIARDEQSKKIKQTDKKDGNDLAVRCINEMKRQIEDGLGKQEILENMVKQFNLSKEELLQLMQNYLITNGAVTLERGRARWNEER